MENIKTTHNSYTVAQVTPLESSSIFTLISYSVLTLGLYIPVWFLLNKKALNNLQSEEKLRGEIFVHTLILASISLIIWFVFRILSLDPTPGIASLQNVTRILDIVVFLTITAQCFKVKRMLNDHFNTHKKFDFKFSDLATFFLQIFYLQHKINKFNAIATSSKQTGN
ncbi:hypothetical protein QA601_04095 [Chitinispirillales bacterium ANBcel5]|uniref:hypothetical protein n=1 Tax=Cellulosispirillum alkaliphilum TaxID=3039283 RepID=UPI002A5785AA|nr:hypothetical protein [Chitinispirillales bacterium ANBcel5]